VNPDTDLKLLRELTSDEDGPSVDAQARARAALLARAQRDTRSAKGRLPRRPGFPLRLEHLALALSGLVAVAVVAVLLNARGTRSSGSPASSGVELVYLAEPTPQTPAVTSASLARAVVVMRSRVAQLGVHAASIRVSGGNEIAVRLPDVKNIALAEREVGATARLEFYDWEANALTPSGKTVASLLQTQDPAAIAISQGGAAGAPGSPGAGSISLYQAVKLASEQPQESSAEKVYNARNGAQYYMFGAPGSAACQIAARAQHQTPLVGSHCLLSGPDDNMQDLINGLPAGVSASEGQTLVVPQGIVVLQATPASFSHPIQISDPNAQFFVLKDHVSLFGNDTTNPQQSTDQTGAPDVTFSFTSKGTTEFSNVTQTIARRGELVSGLGSTLNQHFAVALDTQLITVPSIDYKTYPDGINGDRGADITAGFTISSARHLATELRLGPLPLQLRLIAEEQMPATRG
jgi:preprotein translocase subunit SecD